MCLAKAFLNKLGDNAILEDIAHMRLRDGRAELETLLGEEKILLGKVIDVDFTASKILLDENREVVESS